MLQVSGNLKVVLDHALNITFGKLVPELAGDPDMGEEMVPQKPHALGLIVECRPIESSPSILELSVSQTSFTSTVGLDMKIQSVDTRCVFNWACVISQFYSTANCMYIWG